MQTKLETIKITNSGTLFDGKIWEVGAFTGWTREKIAKQLNLGTATVFEIVAPRTAAEKRESKGIGGIANYGYGI